MTIRFDNRVAIVTGAGGGLGRAYALELARRGAKVVVNDLGGARDGTGHSDAALKVVEEIKAAGGEAISNGGSVTDYGQMVEMVAQAKAQWGRVDILINNAGVLRDKSFAKMEPADFDFVVQVHLLGSANCAKAVWETMREQNYGRILNTASSTGLYGNFGQANYGAAKLGIVALSKCIAVDMGRFNVRSNCIAPVAWTRMTASIPPKDPAAAKRIEQRRQVTAEHNAPLAVFLLSDAAKDVNAQVFSTRKNEIFLMSQSRPLRSVHRADGWTPERCAEHMLPALKSAFYSPTERTADVFSWDSI